MGGGNLDNGVLNPMLACFGLGYCAQHYVGEFGGSWSRLIGTTRSAERAAALGRRSFNGRSVEMLVFDGVSPTRELVGAIAEAHALLISAAPTAGSDPVLTLFEGEIARAPRLRSVIYLSSLGVYDDSGGEWVDETAPTVPAAIPGARARLAAELAWRAVGQQKKLPVAILRLAGIYGPGRNALVRLRRGSAHRIAKPGHVSNRIHVYDIAQAIDAAFTRAADGVFNVVDDEPAPPSDQIAFAARLLGIDPPPEIPYAEADKTVSPLALSFFEGCIRARNDKLKTALDVELRHPTYRHGLGALYHAGDHLL